MIEELIAETISRIEATEARERSRSTVQKYTLIMRYGI